MKLIRNVVIGSVVIVALLFAVGLMLPSGFKVQRAVDFAAAPEGIYPLIADPREWKRWSVWNRRDPAMIIQYSDAPSGAGARWAWQSKTEGSGEMEFTSVVPNERVDYALNFPELGMRSTGQLRLERSGAGTRVTWTNEGDVGGNPVNRYFGLFMDRLVGPDFEAGLKNLKALVDG
jgi:uncharacterized protein YndB with AHSA1/START domain